MRSMVLIALLSLAHPLCAHAAVVPCDTADPMFVCGLQHPEDLVRLGNTHWVIASAINFKMGNPPHDFGPGPVSAIRIDTHTVESLYPTDQSAVAWDRQMFPDCPTPPAVFSSHGLNSRSLEGGKYRLYVANHGSRESVEIIDVAVQGGRLRATWRGCVPVSVKDLGIWPNAVAPMPDGGLVLAGYNVAIWHPGRGWEKLQSYNGLRPGEEGGVGFANGVEVSRDGKWIFIADTIRSAVIRVPVAGGKQTAVKLTFTPDNLRRGEDGLLYVAGPIWPKWRHPGDDEKCFEQPVCVTGIGVASVNPETLVLKDVLHNKEGIKDKFGAPTTALQIEDHLWIGTSRGNRVLIAPLRSNSPE